MNKSQHPSNNFVLGAPKGWDQRNLECGALPVTRSEVRGQPVMISSWTPSPDEIARLAVGAKVALWIFGNTHPPVAVEVSE